MQALLLSAGLGTRLEPLTRYFPKCLAPVQGRPLLGIWLEMLVAAGCKKIFINLHYMPDTVRAFVEQTRYVDCVHWLYEPHLLGTAGTLISCRDQLSDEPLLLVHADNFSQFSLSAMWQAHIDAAPSTAMTMMTFCTDNPRSCGIIEYGDNGKIAAFHEKVQNPPGNYANAAVYIVSKSLIDALPDSINDFSTQVIASHLDQRQTWHNDCCHRDIGTLDSLLQAPLDIVDTLTSPVTEYWQTYWSENDWQRLHKLALDLQFATKRQLVTVNDTSTISEPPIVVIKQFCQTQWSRFITSFNPADSFVLIGCGTADVVEHAMRRSAARYILFAAI